MKYRLLLTVANVDDDTDVMVLTLFCFSHSLSYRSDEMHHRRYMIHLFSYLKYVNSIEHYIHHSYRSSLPTKYYRDPTRVPIEIRAYSVVHFVSIMAERE